jgi:spore coat polysaccharide biosynthesis protein SpsF
MRMVAIIQARMGSTRLPGKVLMDIGGQTMLARVVSRVRRSTLIDEIVVATTINEKDDPIVTECRNLGVPYFRGSEEDVLDRYYQAALAHKAEGIVRITSDCPLIDPGEVDKVVREFLSQEPDYASNSLERTYPRGLDAEVMTMEGLAKAWQEAKEFYQRVHVTPYIYQNPRLFRLCSVKANKDYSSYRWTVDTSEDLSLVRTVYARLACKDVFSWRDALDILEDEPQLAELNRHVGQKNIEEG